MTAKLVFPSLLETDPANSEILVGFCPTLFRIAVTFVAVSSAFLGLMCLRHTESFVFLLTFDWFRWTALT